MVDWNEIVNSYVIESIRDSSYKWWGIDIHFYDKYNKCISESIHPKNSFCDMIHSRSEGAKRCRHCYRVHLKELDKHSKYLSTQCFAGLNLIIIPIIVDEEYVGAIIGSGLKLYEKESSDSNMCLKKLDLLGFDDTTVERIYDSIICLNGSTKEHVNDFLKLAVKDVKVHYKKQKNLESLVKKNKELREKPDWGKYKNIVFTSPAMNEVFETVEIIESSEKTVLIQGETGTGKELLAAAIHYNSPRKDKVFIVQNCSVYNDALLSSELFGHVKGSFTGAISDKKGLFQLADEGTLFLDEIADMSIQNQAALLRVLENGTYYKLGGTELQIANVRIIVATNKDLYTQVEKDLFRKDLFYRINAIPITLPPLRKRKGDVEPLLYHFLESYAEVHNTEEKEICQEVIKLLEDYDWPGNVRELKNQIERLIILSGLNNKIEARHLPSRINSSPISVKHERRNSNRNTLKDILKTVERTTTETELNKANWNKTKASGRLGISRASLNNKIEFFNISRGC